MRIVPLGVHKVEDVDGAITGFASVPNGGMPDGVKFGTALGNYLFVQKSLQLLMRLEQLGVSGPDPALKDDLTNELQRFSRIREEMEAHAHGTLEPGTEKPRIL